MCYLGDVVVTNIMFGRAIMVSVTVLYIVLASLFLFLFLLKFAGVWIGLLVCLCLILSCFGEGVCAVVVNEFGIFVFACLEFACVGFVVRLVGTVPLSCL